MPDTGEPPIVQKVAGPVRPLGRGDRGLFPAQYRHRYYRWALVPVRRRRDGLSAAQDLFAALAGRLQLADVLESAAGGRRIQVPGAKGRKQIAAPKANEYGGYFDRIKKVHDDRGFILRMLQKLPEADRKELPEVAETTEALYQRATELARTLNDMDQSFAAGTPERIRAQLDALALRDQTEERNRQIAILERQLRTATDLATRREAFLQRFESSSLAMQNLRLDLMKLKTQGLGALGDVTSATQQARAISRDVENLTAAASEVREALG